MMEKRGLHPRLLEVDGAAPLVYGELLSSEARRPPTSFMRTTTVTGRSKEWATPPFEPVLRTARLDQEAANVIPFPGQGRRFDPEWRIYARAASDDKAPIMAMLSALVPSMLPE